MVKLYEISLFLKIDAFSLVEKSDQSERGQTDQQFPISILILSGLRIIKTKDFV